MTDSFFSFVPPEIQIFHIFDKTKSKRFYDCTNFLYGTYPDPDVVLMSWPAPPGTHHPTALPSMQCLNWEHLPVEHTLSTINISATFSTADYRNISMFCT